MMALLLAAAVPSAAKTPATMKILSVTGGTLTLGKEALEPGAELTPGKEVILSSGAEAVLDAKGWGKLFLHGPVYFTPRAEGDDGVEVRAGGILAKLKSRSGRAFSIGTPAAVAAVRGTTFFVEARSKKQSYICICRGELSVESRVEKFRTVIKSGSDNHHKPYLFRAGGGASSLSEAAMERHSDEEIESLDAK